VRALGHLPADWRKRDRGIAPPSQAGRQALFDHRAGDDRGHAHRAPDPDALAVHATTTESYLARELLTLKMRLCDFDDARTSRLAPLPLPPVAQSSVLLTDPAIIRG
jgi:hypothetical protein